VPHDVVEPKTGSKKKLVMQLDRDVQVCGIFLFVFLSTPYFEILLLLLFWRGLKDRLGDQRGGSEWEPIKILLEGD
jgi:hypothetical protein